MKIIVLGHRQHGKDEVAKQLAVELGLRYEMASEIAVDLFIFDTLKGDFNYQTPQACYEDRINHRSLWFYLFREYTRKDPARLVREVFRRCDFYTGLRSDVEFKAVRAEGLVDAVVFVDASKRCEPEPWGSMRLGPEDADYVLDNNGTLEDLQQNIRVLAQRLRQKQA